MNRISESEPVFLIEGREWMARGKLVEDGFVVFEGSTVNTVNESFRKEKSYYPVRIELEQTGVIEDMTFTRDYIFRSASQAGSVVACRPISANKDWKTDDENEIPFGEVHPKKRGEKRDYSKAVMPSPASVRPAGTSGFLEDGTPFAVTEDENFETEWRGNIPFCVRAIA